MIQHGYSGSCAPDTGCGIGYSTFSVGIFEVVPTASLKNCAQPTLIDKKGWPMVAGSPATKSPGAPQIPRQAPCKDLRSTMQAPCKVVDQTRSNQTSQKQSPRKGLFPARSTRIGRAAVPTPTNTGERLTAAEHWPARSGRCVVAMASGPTLAVTGRTRKSGSSWGNLDCGECEARPTARV